MRVTRQSASAAIAGIALLAASLFAAAPSYAGGAVQTCRNWRGSGSGPINGGPTRITADCKTKAGTYKTTYVDLPYCVANYRGNFNWWRNGHYEKSCRNLALWSDFSYYTAECKTPSGSWHPTTLFLDQLSNWDGNLVCPLPN